MKKILIFLVLISSFTYSFGFAAGKGINSNGIFSIDGTSIDTTDSNGIYTEFYINQDQIPGSVGFGLKLNDLKKDGTGEQVSFIATFYGAIRYELDLSSVKPYALVKIGYPYAAEGDYIKDYNNPSNAYTNDLKGIGYISLGAGIKLYFVDASIGYEYNTFKLSSTDGSSDKDVYSGNVSLNVGVKF